MHRVENSRWARRRGPQRFGAVVLVAASLGLAACSDDSGLPGDSPDTTVTETTAVVGDEETTAPGDTTATTAPADTTAPPATGEPSTTVADAASITDAAVARADDGGQLTVTWTGGSDATQLLWGPSPDAIDQPVDAPIESGSVTLADPAPGARAFFRIVDGDTAVTVAERRVVLEGAPNFRDLGGYATDDGRHVKWGQVYRSGELAELTEADLETVDQIGIALVCDLRSDAEVADAPDPEAASDEHLSLAVNDDSVDVVALTNAIAAGDLSGISPDLLLEGMPKIALDFTDNWSELLRRISDPANRPTNFHCTAGKDRAGWAAATVLRALGVPEETVMQDYLLSNDNLAASNAETLATVRTIVAGVNGVPEDQVDLSNLEALLDVRPEYLQAAFDAVDAKFGSFDGYLTDGLGLSEAEITALRDSMLE